MSKTKLLLDVANDLRTLADSISAVVDAMTDNAETSTPTKPKSVNASSVTLEQVRAVLADKSRAGFTAQIRELLLKHGAAKLSDIDPAQYPALIEEAEGLTNG